MPNQEMFVKDLGSAYCRAQGIKPVSVEPSNLCEYPDLYFEFIEGDDEEGIDVIAGIELI